MEVKVPFPDFVILQKEEFMANVEMCYIMFPATLISWCFIHNLSPPCNASASERHLDITLMS